MITGTTLKSEVIALLELNNDSDSVTKFKVYENINAAVRYICRIFPLSEIDNAIKTDKGNMLSGVSAYQWPSTFIRFIQLWLDYNSAISQTNPGYEVGLVPDGRFYPNSLDQRPTRYAPKFDFVEGGFDIRPVPDSNLANGIRLRYVQAFPDVSDSQNCLLREDLRNAIVLEAGSLCCLVDNYNLELSNILHQRFFEEYKAFGGNNRDILNDRGDGNE